MSCANFEIWLCESPTAFTFRYKDGDKISTQTLKLNPSDSILGTMVGLKLFWLYGLKLLLKKCSRGLRSHQFLPDLRPQIVKEFSVI